jgi:hypothetical protein
MALTSDQEILDDTPMKAPGQHEWCGHLLRADDANS